MKLPFLQRTFVVIMFMLVLSVLPSKANSTEDVELASFTAEYIPPCDLEVLIEWETVTELDTAGFFVMRSFPPNLPDQTISPIILSMGSPTIGSEYSFIDDDVVPGSNYYYRLAIVDVMNNIEYSEIISIYPTPITADYNVYLPIVVELDDDWAFVDPSGQTLIFWHTHSRAREEVLMSIVEDFNNTNEWGITVMAEYQGGYGDIFTKMLAVLGTEDAPDLVIAYQTQAATYQLADGLLDMTPLVESAQWGLPSQERDDFFDAVYNADIYPTFDGSRLGFPPSRSIEVMYYNQDWLTELGYNSPPATPAEFKEIACKAAATPFSGATAAGSRGYELSIDASRFASWTFAHGGDVFDYEKVQYSYNNESAAAAMTLLQDIITAGCASVVTERYGDQTNFGQGTTLFTVGSTSGLPYYRSAVEEGADFNWSVAPVPYTTAEPVQNVYGASISIPVHKPEAQLASWLFLKYYTSPEVQSTWAQTTNYFPVRASAAEYLEADGYFAANPAYETAFGLLQYGTSEPAVPGYDFVRDIVEEALAAIAGGADVQSTLNQLNEDANDNLSELVTP